jgi:hypothetical protein
MALSKAQMERMNRLLDEALDLDETERRSWLAALGSDARDLEPALRRALLPADLDEGEAATLPRIPAALSEPGFKPGARVGPYELGRL